MEKSLDEFNNDCTRKDGKTSWCKKCVKEKTKNYHKKNREQIHIYEPNQTKICSSCEIEKTLDEFYNDKSKKDGKSNYCKKCEAEYNRPEKYKQYYKEYNQINKEKILEQTRNNARKRYNNDYLYKLTKIIRKIVRKSFKSGEYKKTDLIGSTEKILGCTFEYAKKYMEEKMEDWMTWNNHGKYNGTEKYGWDIDHIIPLSSAKTEKDILKLCHYTNLQPLDSYINRDIKRNKIEYEINKC